MKPQRFACVGFLVAGLLTGCATTEKEPAAGTAKTDSDDYAAYTPTGSHISDRVQKKKLKTSAEKKNYDEQLMQKMQQEQPDPQGPLPH